MSSCRKYTKKTLVYNLSGSTDTCISYLPFQVLMFGGICVCVAARWGGPDAGRAAGHGGQTAAADHLPAARPRRQGAAPQVPQATGAAPPAAGRGE